MFSKLNILLTAACFCAASAAASAATVTLSNKVGLDELERICAASGGIFWSDLSGYSCTRKNCDGKGNSCIVACSTDGVCTGTVPKKLPSGPERLKSILSPSINQAQ